MERILNTWILNLSSVADAIGEIKEPEQSLARRNYRGWCLPGPRPHQEKATAAIKLKIDAGRRYDVGQFASVRASLLTMRPRVHYKNYRSQITFFLRRINVVLPCRLTQIPNVKTHLEAGAKAPQTCWKFALSCCPVCGTSSANGSGIAERNCPKIVLSLRSYDVCDQTLKSAERQQELYSEVPRDPHRKYDDKSSALTLRSLWTMTDSAIAPWPGHRRRQSPKNKSRELEL
ncbi:hypothetical protein Bbelb_294540 [Branchiostoma belcheri]|nr:hypothetical protein Bbelb_294540 [Branchiostoma belcheri]